MVQECLARGLEGFQVLGVFEGAVEPVVQLGDFLGFFRSFPLLGFLGSGEGDVKAQIRDHNEIGADFSVQLDEGGLPTDAALGGTHQHISDPVASGDRMVPGISVDGRCDGKVGVVLSCFSVVP